VIKALTLEDLDREIQQVRHRMRRFAETGDLKRLAKLRGRLTKLQADLGILREIEATRTRPRFRKSYSFEAWCEKLQLAGKQQGYMFALK
jgi:hypothetical protein